MERLYLDTGIPELNDLLTCNPNLGIGLPGHGEIQSSTFVIKAHAGAGKSVLSSILAFNLQNRKQATYADGLCREVTPFVVYFSFAQPASELYSYIHRILDPPGEFIHPVIVSPSFTAKATHEEGLPALRRCLLEHLTHLLPLTNSDPLCLSTDPVEGDRLDKWLDWFRNSTEWDIGAYANNKLQPAPGSYEKILPIVIIDPVNSFSDGRDSRATIDTLFQTFRRLKWPLILALEDPGQKAVDAQRQWSNDVEFAADIVIELASETEPYPRRTIEVIKSRHSGTRIGRQRYRIAGKEHALANIESSWKRNHPGIHIFKSTHWVISTERSIGPRTLEFSSGIHEFDRLLGVGTGELGRLPENCVVLISGEKGAHKLTVGFNLMLGGVWSRGEVREGANIDEHTEKRVPPRTVLLLSFGEETGINVSRIGLAKSLVRSPLDNSSHVESIRSSGAPDSQNQKVVIKEWQVANCERIIEVTFRPGYLGADEFLWVVLSLIEKHTPARILIDNTAHIQTRFPGLADDKMLFPALTSIAHSRNIILIIIDVTNPRASNRQLTYGLEASADYIVDMKTLTDGHILAVEREHAELKRSGLKWAKLTLRNVRDKNYIVKEYALTVLRELTNRAENSMYMIELPDQITGEQVDPPGVD